MLGTLPEAGGGFKHTHQALCTPHSPPPTWPPIPWKGYVFLGTFQASTASLPFPSCEMCADHSVGAGGTREPQTALPVGVIHGCG